MVKGHPNVCGLHWYTLYFNQSVVYLIFLCVILFVSFVIGHLPLKSANFLACFVYVSTDIPTTSPVKSSTYDLSHTETTSYSNAIPTPMMMNDHSASSGIIPTAVFEMATTQLPSSVYDMEQLDISPLPTSIEEERTGVKSSRL